MKRDAGFRLAGLVALMMIVFSGSAAQAEPAYDNGYTYQTLPPPPPAEDGYPPPPGLPDAGYDQSYYPPVTSLDQVPAIPGDPVPEFGDGAYDYAPPPMPVVSVYLQPALVEPPPIAIPWAPPPMLVEVPPPMPFFGAVWTGGYWAWQGQWVWAAGQWMAPPMAGYLWTQPYYENRNGMVIFIPGFWRGPGVMFMRPPLVAVVPVVRIAPGVIVGPRPIGPNGCFVPAPPGSRLGLIVSAPIGTAPAVVVGAPPVIRAGMRVGFAGGGRVRITAPAGVAESGRPVSLLAPAAARLAAAQRPVVRMLAPPPAVRTPMRGFSLREGAPRLPPARIVRPQASRPAWLQRAPQQPMRGPGGAGNAPPSRGFPPQRFRSEGAPAPRMQPRAVPPAPARMREQPRFAPPRTAPRNAAPRPVARPPEREGGHPGGAERRP